MTANTKYSTPRLGQGIYTVPDASLILDFPKTRLRRWIHQYWKSDFTEGNGTSTGNSYIWGKARETAFNFYTLIEIFTVISLREIGVSFKTIKHARVELSGLFKTRFPFAAKPLMSDGRKVIIELGKTNLLELGTGGQTALRKIIEPFCKKLDFSLHNNLANRFWPLGKTHSIVVDPKHGFGRPTITGTNISTEAIYGLLNAGEEKETVADLYNLTDEQIDDVLIFQTRMVT
ncbi:MAG: DUF433 domain-containing protein [bacterium]